MNFARAVVVSAREETADARTLVLRRDGWSGHIAGQHVDLKLTAPDGYTAVRSYSIASSAAGSGPDFEVTIDRLVDGEVSPYLIDEIAAGDELEVRGPAGGWFTWSAVSEEPVQLIGGGSGIVPLMAMIRTHRDTTSSAPMRLLYSVRSVESALFRDELIHNLGDAIDVQWAFSRSAPAGWPHAPARLTREAMTTAVFAPNVGARTYVCGSTPFVESIADWLVDADHDPATIRTERFGG